MRRTAKAIAFLVGFLPFAAVAQVANYPQTLPPNTVVGRLGVSAGPSQAIPFAVFLSNLSGSQSANTVYSAPSGVAGFPTFRFLTCADISNTSIYCPATRGQLPGTATNDSAGAGNIGEYVESVVGSGSAVSLVTGTSKTVTSISLTAGDWDVTGTVYYLFPASTSYQSILSSISGTTNTSDLTPGKFISFFTAATVPGAGVVIGFPIQKYRLSLGSTTSVFLIGQASFTASTLSAYGMVRARRVR